MSTLAGELAELRDDPAEWVTHTIENFIVVSVLALTVAFPLHLAFNPVVAVLGYPHQVGSSYWASVLVVLGFIVVVSMLRYALGLLDTKVRKEKAETMELAGLMAAIGVAAWLATWFLTGSAF